MMSLEAFRSQVKLLAANYEMASVESALRFLGDEYHPERDLCLLTFDDGLREHYESVTPVLAELGVQGLFFPITSCLDGRVVAPVHMNHFLLERLGLSEYRTAFLEQLQRVAPSFSEPRVEEDFISRIYRWDTPETARFKYLLNFVLERGVRDCVIRQLFEQVMGAEDTFADELYFNWDEARDMQKSGMVLGGHSHWHQPLSRLRSKELAEDLCACRESLVSNLHPQTHWPFSYPYGKGDSFTPAAVSELQELGFHCAFSTIVGTNLRGDDHFAVRRIDCKEAPG